MNGKRSAANAEEIDVLCSEGEGEIQGQGESLGGMRSLYRPQTSQEELALSYKSTVCR